MGRQGVFKECALLRERYAIADAVAGSRVVGIIGGDRRPDGHNMIMSDRMVSKLPYQRLWAMRRSDPTPLHALQGNSTVCGNRGFAHCMEA